jgi:hypothetical protein
LIDYLGSGTLIFGIVPPGTSASLLVRLGGAVADPSDPTQVAKRLAHAIAAAKQRRQSDKLLPWGDGDVRAEFYPETVAQMFLGMVGKVTQANSQR